MFGNKIPASTWVHTPTATSRRQIRERDWYVIAEQPAPAPRRARPEGCAALRIVLVTVPPSGINPQPPILSRHLPRSVNSCENFRAQETVHTRKTLQEHTAPHTEDLQRTKRHSRHKKLPTNKELCHAQKKACTHKRYYPRTKSMYEGVMSESVCSVCVCVRERVCVCVCL